MSLALIKDIDTVVPPPTGWDLSGGFSADDVLHAHEMGMQKNAVEIVDAHKKVLEKQFIENFQKAHRVTEELFDALAKDNAEPVRGYLRVQNGLEFDVIMCVSENTFYSNQLDTAYLLSQAAEMNNNEETFRVSISIMKDSSNIDGEQLIMDGYSRRYEPSSKKS